MERPMLSPAYQDAIRRDRIIRAAAEVFAEHGYRDVSVTDLVKRSRCGRALFYELFEGKEDCFRAVVDLTTSLFKTLIQDRHSDPDVIVDADRVLVELMDFVDANPVLAQCAILHAPQAAPDLFEKIRDQAAEAVPLREPMSDLVAGGVTEVLRLYLAGLRERPSLVDLHKFVAPALEAFV